MNDREKVMKGLKSCGWTNQNRDYCEKQGCPYTGRFNDGDCVGRLHKDAKKLLKEGKS